MTPSLPSRKRRRRRADSFNCLFFSVTSALCCPGHGFVAPATPGIFASRSCAMTSTRARMTLPSTCTCTSSPHHNYRRRACHILNLFPDWKDFDQWARSHMDHNATSSTARHDETVVEEGRGDDDREDTSMNHFNLTKTSSARLYIDDDDNDKAPHFNTLPLSSSSSSKFVKSNKTNSSKTDRWTGPGWAPWTEPVHVKNGSKDTKKKAKDSVKSSKKLTSKTVSSSEPSLGLPPGRDPTAPLTLSDLEAILDRNGYVRKSDLRSNRDESILVDDSSAGKGVFGGRPSSSGSKTAFPQPSVLSYRDVRIGTTLVSALFGFVLSTSVLRNLWLVGASVGAFYGHSVAEDGVIDPDLGPVAQLLVNCGRSVAKKYLQIYDFWQGMWFMYRTGQLSYSYWKRYETLDQRFGIQDKMDAWNARFVQGKNNFDRWEKENEIGRKVLATLRTVWMVEEQSYRKQLKGRQDRLSRYVVVAYIQNFFAWLRRLGLATWQVVFGNRQFEMSEFFKGIQVQISELSARVVIQRAGSAAALLVLVTAIGALFASAPGMLSVIAIVSGVLWPDWLGAAWLRMLNIVDETRALGRQGTDGSASTTSSVAPTRNSATKPPRFHYFERKDGSKRYYRTGRPLLVLRELKGADSDTSNSGQLRNFFSSINPFSQTGMKPTDS
mmetsp:Transcript_24889/g.54271  ORF Transcript_24889/g.54271 Transcript_24889/m.54271 type:complete len:666 (-) Transcript_24889:2362-4359(-)